MNSTHDHLRLFGLVTALFLSSSIGATPVDTDPPAQSGTSCRDASGFLAGDESDLVPGSVRRRRLRGPGCDFENDGDLDLTDGAASARQHVRLFRGGPWWPPFCEREAWEIRSFRGKY